MTELKPPEVSALTSAIGELLCEIGQRHRVDEIFVGLSVAGDHIFLCAKKGGEDVIPSGNLGFDIGCVLKPFISAVAIQLSLDGKLDLDSHIGEYLIDLATSSKGYRISVRHLLTNTVGYRGFVYFPLIDFRRNATDALARIKGAQELFLPGTVFSYENSASALLCAILERVTSLGPARLLEKMVFEPLGIPYLVRASANPHSVLFSLPELLIASETLLGGAGLSVRTGEILRAKAVDIPRRRGSRAEALMPVASGNSLFIYRAGFSGYDGMALTQTVGLRLWPDSRIAVVLGINQPARHLRRAILKGIADCILGYHLPRPQDTKQSSSPDRVLPPIGGYYVGNHAFDAIVTQETHTIVRGISPSQKPLFLVRTNLDGGGNLSANSSYAPAFFTHSRTGESALMIGMTALKRIPIARWEPGGTIQLML